MNNCAEYIKGIVERKPQNQIIEANRLYEKMPDGISEAAYYKALERLSKQGVLVHLSRGLYYRPAKSKFGIIPISEEEIIEHYIGSEQGMIIGYRLYNRLGLTTQIGKQIQILSSALDCNQKSIGNIRVAGCNLPFSAKTVAVIETMEVLQNYRQIEDINKAALASYMERFAAAYSDGDCILILKSKRYKKSTIAFLASFLDYHGIKNSLHRFLSSLSNYKIPSMEEFYESARA